MQMLKYKVIGSYSIHTFYSHVFEVDPSPFPTQTQLLAHIENLAREEEREGLKNWEIEREELVGDGFYIDEIELLT